MATCAVTWRYSAIGLLIACSLLAGCNEQQNGLEGPIYYPLFYVIANIFELDGVHVAVSGYLRDEWLYLSEGYADLEDVASAVYVGISYREDEIDEVTGIPYRPCNDRFVRVYGRINIELDRGIFPVDRIVQATNTGLSVVCWSNERSEESER